jgi:hypothetical protein
VRCGARRRRGRNDSGRRILASFNDPRDGLAHRYISAFGRFDSCQKAIRRRFDFDHSFISFYVEKRLALNDAIPFLLPPSQELSGFLRHLESGHNNAEGHSFFGEGRLWPSV